MPSDDQTDPDADTTGADPAEPGPMFSRFGIASAVLAVLAVAAVVCGGLAWSRHSAAEAARSHQSDVLQVAAQWANTLVNMNAENVEASLATLRDGTVGELNTDFEAVLGPFRDVVQKVKAATTGQIDAVAIESVRRDDGPAPEPALPDGLAERTESVIVVANATSQNAAGKPQARSWLLRLEVAEVDGQLLISRLEPLR